MPSSVNCGFALWMDGGTYNGVLGRTSHVAASFLNTGSAQVWGGVLPSGGAMAVAAGSGMTVTVATGYVLCPSSGGSSQGGYLFALTSAATLTVAASNPSNPRIDLVVAYANDLGTSSSQAIVAVITGVPAASPVAPAAPSNAVILAQVLVPAGSSSVTSGNITDKRPFTVSAGGILPVPSLSAVPAGYTGLYLHDLTTGRLVHNPASGPAQPHLLPFAPAQQVVTSNVNTTSNAYVTAASVTVTTDGATDIEIYAKWNYGELAATDGSLTLQVLIGSSVVDTVTMWGYDQPLASGGSLTHRTSTARSDRPSAGVHVISLQFSVNAASSFNPGTLAAPIELYVRPVIL